MERYYRIYPGPSSRSYFRCLPQATLSYTENPSPARHSEIEVTPGLGSEKELLFFTLFSLKAGLTYDVLGFVSGLDGSNAKRNQTLGLTVLEHALQSAHCLPRRKFKDKAEFAEYLQREETLIFDGLEQRMQRPADDEARARSLLRKKKGHTLKAVTMSNPGRRILYLSECWVGKTHDYRMFQPWVSSGRKLVHRFPCPRGPGFFRDRKGLHLQRTADPTQKTEEAGANTGTKSGEQVTGERENCS